MSFKPENTKINELLTKALYDFYNAAKNKKTKKAKN